MQKKESRQRDSIRRAVSATRRLAHTHSRMADMWSALESAMRAASDVAELAACPDATEREQACGTVAGHVGAVLADVVHHVGVGDRADADADELVGELPPLPTEDDDGIPY